jgi:CRISPR-associated Csx3 family protein
LNLPTTVRGMGAIFEGAAPIWGYAMLCHAGHKLAWVATYDPRLRAGIVVQSHWPGVSLGDEVEM